MFTVEARERLRDGLVSAAQADGRISAAALVGSAALDFEDQWSDIDLALCIEAGAKPTAVIADWTDSMYAEHGAVHHVDVPHGETLYRVFLLADTLQVDLRSGPQRSFAPSARAFACCSEPPGKRPPLRYPAPPS